MKSVVAIIGCFAFVAGVGIANAGTTLYKGISKYNAGDKETTRCSVITESDSSSNILKIKVDGTSKNWDVIENGGEAMSPKTEYARTSEELDLSSGIYEKRDHWFNDGFTLSTKVTSTEIRTNGRNELQVDVKDGQWMAVFFKNSIKTMAVLPLATREIGCFNLVKVQGD